MTKNEYIGKFRINSEMKKKWIDDANKENRKLTNYIINAVENHRKNKGKRFGEDWIDYKNLERYGIIKKKE